MKKSVPPEPILKHSDPGSLRQYLEDVLREELGTVGRERQKQLNDIEQKYEMELQNFRREETAKAETLLAAEKDKISRTFDLQRRRAVAEEIENLIQQVIRDAAKSLSNSEEFTEKISPLVSEEVSSGDVIVKILFAPGDDVMKKKIASLMKKKIDFEEDYSIRYGGLILVKKSGEMINLTVDRLIFRMQDALRLEMMHLFREEGVLAKLEGIND